MPRTLVIVESPAKARTIGKFLGRSYQVKASMGHVIDLPRSQFGIDVEKNFRPKYITIRGKGKIIKDLKDAVKKVERVYLATDPDREGEAISWHLTQALNLDPSAPCRIEFNEITKKAVVDSIKHPRGIDYNRVNAQQARRILDRLVGYKLSPLLWSKVKRGLSAGRVQSGPYASSVTGRRRLKISNRKSTGQLLVPFSPAGKRPGPSAAMGGGKPGRKRKRLSRPNWPRLTGKKR